MQDYRVQEYRLPSPPSIKCNVLRESLSEDSQNIPCATLKERGSWVIFKYLWYYLTGVRISPSVSDPDRINLGQMDPDLGCPRQKTMFDGIEELLAHTKDVSERKKCMS